MSVGVALWGEDRLPRGPRRDLVLALRVYYDELGRPPVRNLEQHMKDTSPRDMVSRQTVQTALSGQTVPRWSSLRRLVRAFIGMRPAGKRPDLDQVMDELRPLWLAAIDDASEAQVVSEQAAPVTDPSEQSIPVPDSEEPARPEGDLKGPVDDETAAHQPEDDSGELGRWLSLPRYPTRIEDFTVVGAMAYNNATNELAGDTATMLRLADHLVTRDPAAAEHWLEEAAKAGSETAMVRLADRLMTRDAAAAEHWLQEAAEAGDEPAIARLAVLRHVGFSGHEAERASYQD